MTSPLKTARDTIVTLWEALTPETDPGRTFEHWTSRGRPRDASGHRAFFFEPLTSSAVLDWNADETTMENIVFAVILYSLQERTAVEVFDIIADERSQLQGAINHHGVSFGAGVSLVRATQAETRPIDDDLELRIRLEIETEET